MAKEEASSFPCELILFGLPQESMCIKLHIDLLGISLM
jgi:hypothetical protein